MKKYLIVLLIAAAFAFVSCEKVPEVSLDKVSEEMGYRGGVLEFDVTANCDWEIICSSDDIDLLTVSQWTGGPGTQTITVNVDRNQTNSILKHYFTAVAHGSKRDALSSLTLTQGAPAYVIFNKKVFTADYIGGEYKFTVSSNFPWEISVEGEGVTVEPMSGVPQEETDEEETPAPSGEGEDDEEELEGNVITVTIDEYEGDEDRQFVLNVIAHGNDTDVTDQLVITQNSPELIIGGRPYRIKKMGDGRWWMIDNLCFSNKGITIGDGICGVWYPCSDSAAQPDESTEGIISKGLLYSDAVAFNTNITKTTAKRQEGAQGICPEGWHIPTLAEYMALVGKCQNAQVPVVEDAPYYDASRNCGSLPMLKAAGFVGSEAGYIQGSGSGYSNGFSTQGYLASRGYVTTTYFFCSTHYSEQMWYALILNEVNNQANVGYMNNWVSSRPFAGCIRCIKNKEKE